MARKGRGREAKLNFTGHVLMENRSGLAVDVLVTQATGKAEYEAGLKMLGRLRRRQRRLTLGADKVYDTQDFVTGCRELEVTPHVAQNINCQPAAGSMGGPSAILATPSASGLANGLRKSSAGSKTVAGGRKLRYLGVKRNQLWADLATTAYNLVRLGNLLAEAA